MKDPAFRSWLPFALAALVTFGGNSGARGEPASAAAAETGKNPAAAGAPSTETAAGPSHVATLDVSDLRDYDTQPLAVKRLLAQALALTTLNLSYRYGSSDPKNGGMDCSGTVYYLLKTAGVKDVPRDSGEMYKWVWTHGRFQAVVSSNPDSFELDRLKPGDLLFWTGTYRVDRDPPVTHVMIYLGVERRSGHRVMVGASEGRRYDGKPRYGVSVFDFEIPRPARQADGSAANDLQSRFIGYGSVPGLDEAQSRTDDAR